MSTEPTAGGLRNRLRSQTGDRCGYCRSHQRYVLGLLEIEHIRPLARGGTSDEENLWLACRLCNSYKGTQLEGFEVITRQVVRLFNPRTQKWSEHFRWNETGDQIIGMTACGRVTVTALQLNNVLAVTVRRAWISAGWHPPQEE
jgi:hypothetical protein